MLKTYRVSLLALTLAVPAFAGTASAADADAVAQICAEAQSLFEEIKALPPEEGLPGQAGDGPCSNIGLYVLPAPSNGQGRHHRTFRECRETNQPQRLV